MRRVKDNEMKISLEYIVNKNDKKEMELEKKLMDAFFKLSDYQNLKEQKQKGE